MVVALDFIKKVVDLWLLCFFKVSLKKNNSAQIARDPGLIYMVTCTEERMKSVWRGWKSCFMGVVVVFLLPSCSALKPMPPEVSLAGISVESLTLSQADLIAKLRIFNPNRIGVNIDQVDYTLKLAGVKVSNGQSLTPARIEARQSGDLDMKLSASYLSLMQVLSGLTDKDEVDFVIEGSVQVSGLGVVTKTFPIQRQGNIALKDLALR